MSPSSVPQGPSPSDDPREIARWTLAYAQNRTLGVAVFLVIFLILSAAIGGLSFLGGWAYLKGNMVLLGTCIGALGVAVAALIYFSVPRWGGKRMEQMTKSLYAKEGSVTVATPQTAGRQPLLLAVGLGFVASVLASLILGLLGYIPDWYMQPVSALYVVPFLVTLTILMRPAVGWIAFLWPVLYGVHAILIVLGAPILFAGKWDILNMLLPTVGYGLLTALLGHVYSRYALHNLKRLARMGPEA